LTIRAARRGLKRSGREYATSPPTGLLGVGLGGDSTPRMIVFQARLEYGASGHHSLFPNQMLDIKAEFFCDTATIFRSTLRTARIGRQLTRIGPVVRDN
jgi:hypothetical protein